VSILFTRREALAMIAAAPAALAAQGSQLPLKTSGLEHVGFTVPNPQKSATFYGRIFDPQIFQEMMPPLRYYCRLGIGYVAFGRIPPPIPMPQRESITFAQRSRTTASTRCVRNSRPKASISSVRPDSTR
jgi:hypothetical protein